MSYSDLIHKYFDGELESEEVLEETLFDALKSDADVRQDFTDHLRIRSLCQEDMTSITTPSECTQNVFMQLGFQIPGAVTQQAAVNGAAVAPAVPVSRRFMSYAITALVSSLLTIAVFMFALDSGELLTAEGDGTNDNNEAENSLASNKNTLAAGRSEIPVVRNILSDDASADSRSSGDVRSASAATASESVGDQALTQQPAETEIAAQERQGGFEGISSTNTSAISTADAAASDIQASEAFPAEEAPIPLQDVPDNDERSIPAVLASAMLPSAGNAPSAPQIGSREARILGTVGISLPVNENLPFSIAYRRIASSTNPNPRLTTDVVVSDPLLDNALSLVYNLSPQQAIGIEVSREAYGQEFTATVDGRPDQLVRQSPSYYWVAALYRHRIQEWELAEQLFPYFQVGLGAISSGESLGKFSGGMMRLVVGSQFFLTKNIVVNGGLEVSGISYSTSDLLETSYNTGFTYGIQVNF